MDELVDLKQLLTQFAKEIYRDAEEYINQNHEMFNSEQVKKY